MAGVILYKQLENMAEMVKVKLFQNDNTNKKTKKFVSVLGDSISTYKGFTAD